ncbi:transient receptor potential protein [Chrysoperla carnea]|uniref:transient receptor potential protein n=1 Tax=Chrysoperla carnea TaxID=189513 RepID=UPI001D06AE16|nr:transient receptor potential protein [Chrysoperla carnea]
MSSRITESREDLLVGSEEIRKSRQSIQSNFIEHVLTPVEKTFLLHAERGDCATVRKLIEDHKDQTEILDINCVDPLNRSALISAIENENIELIKILLEAGIQVKDSLLHAIKEEYVEAVEILLRWEEENHQPGTPYSWEAIDRSAATFTADITPLILAAHKNNYEIIKILLDRGATLPMPHDVKCGCDECVTSSETDSLCHSQSRINAYRALTASSLIALSSKDPLLTAFELSWELRRLSRMETEFRKEYNELRANSQQFATSLLDHARTSYELEIMLNFDTIGDNWDPGERQTLERLKMAIKYKQKHFVAHPNVQQLLASIWYEGLPGFRRKTIVGQLFQVAQLAAMFPIYSTIYMMAPYSKYGRFMKKPFVKFICHSSSYCFFLMLLGIASQRLEILVLEWFGTDWMQAIVEDWKRKERGAGPGFAECGVILYMISLIWGEIRALWTGGIAEYMEDLWNIVDCMTNFFYVAWLVLRIYSYYTVQMDDAMGKNPWIPREQWEPFDPMLLSEGAFAAGMIFSFLKLVHIFSVNPHLGPLQISLGRMIIDILKFFFIYTLVLFAFGCGLNQLLWYYANIEKNKCYHLPNGLPDYDQNEKACSIWRRYANLFETSQSLFWASFGLVDLMNFELTGIKEFTRFWALLMFGSYSVINIIVLLNMLIAMMSNSYQIISERADTEWKFARSKLWMSYFEEGDTVPPPFNIFPTPKTFYKLCRRNKRQSKSFMNKSRERAEERHATVMRLLVRRYVTAEQRKRDDYGITEDDVMEIRQDISTLRYELIDILRQNGMRTPVLNVGESTIAGKKGRIMERRLLKDFTIGTVEGVQNIISSTKEPRDVFSQIAKAIGKRASSKNKSEEWNTIVRQSTIVRDPIGSTTEAAFRNSRHSLKRYIASNTNNVAIDQNKLLEYNPRLVEVPPTARLAYAKFMKAKLKQDEATKQIIEDVVKVEKQLSRDNSQDHHHSRGSSLKSLIALKGLLQESLEIQSDELSEVEKKEIILSPSPILEADEEAEARSLYNRRSLAQSPDMLDQKTPVKIVEDTKIDIEESEAARLEEEEVQKDLLVMEKEDFTPSLPPVVVTTSSPPAVRTPTPTSTRSPTPSIRSPTPTLSPQSPTPKPSSPSTKSPSPKPTTSSTPQSPPRKVTYSTDGKSKISGMKRTGWL